MTAATTGDATTGNPTTARASLPRPRDVLGQFGLYVHVPFCVHRCWYCDFNAYAGLDHLADDYMRALADDARLALSAPYELGERPEVTSIFVGGGTPSHVPGASLVAVLEAIRDSWPVDPECEITIECNPESAEAAKLASYRDAGVKRLSFGVQSLDDRLLQTLGRAHDSRTALDAIRRAHAAGFDDVNADLIFGVPGEDDATWRRSVDGIVETGVSHVSCYGLTYEEGTPLDAWRRLGKVVPVPDDDVARRWEIADETLSAAGFERYEISNWSKPGRECRHNTLYWSCGEYLGLGAGAHSHLSAGDSIRSWTVKAPAAYTRSIARERRPVGGSERVGARARCAEVMFLGLRRVPGVTASRFRALTEDDLEATYGPVLRRLRSDGLLEWDGRRAALTRRGTLLANEAVTPFLMDDADDAI